MAASVVHLGEIYHPDNKQLITIIPIGVSIHDYGRGYIWLHKNTDSSAMLS